MRVCSKCGKPALDESVAALGRVYHAGCFCCVKCNKQLPSSFRVVDDAPWCTTCHLAHKVPKCFACRKPAEGGITTEVFPGRVWHEACLACIKCRTQLRDSFRDVGGEMWCPPCHSKHKAPKCLACKKPAEDGVTTSAFPGKIWHEECFACSGCKAVLHGAFKNVDQTLWCEACHADKFLPRCASCSKPVSGSVLTVGAASYHPTCLTCAACKTQLSGKMHRHKESMLCPPCNDQAVLKKCEKCHGLIREGTWPQWKDGSYHSACFTCLKCAKPVSGAFYEQESGVICKECGGR